MIGEDVHLDGERQDMGGHDEDQNQDLHHLNDFPGDGAADILCGVGKAVHAHMLHLELVDDKTSVSGQNPKTSDDEHAWHETDGRNDFGQGQNA